MFRSDILQEGKTPFSEDVSPNAVLVCSKQSIVVVLTSFETTTLTMNQENSRCALVLFALVLLITGSEAQKSLTSVTPSCGPTGGTTAVTLRGSGFAEGDVAKIGNNLLLGRHTVFESTTELKLLISRKVAKASKNYSLEVVAKDGRTVSNKMSFYIYDFPNLIESISPKVGWQGDTVTAVALLSAVLVPFK